MLKYIIAVTNTALPPVIMAALFLRIYGIRTSLFSRRPLWAGFWIGAVASIVLVVLKKNTGFVVREYYNLGVLLPTLAVEAFLAVMILLPRKDPLSGFPLRAFQTLALLTAALWTAFSLPDILFYPFDFSVGMDTIFNTRYAYKVIGYCIGIILAVLALSGLTSIVGQFSRRTMKFLFLLSLAVFVGKQLLTILQIGLGRNLLPRSPTLVKFTIDMLNRASWFMFALMGIAAISAAVIYFRNKRGGIQGPNPAIIRKLKATARRYRRWCAALAVVLIADLLSVTVGAAYENQDVVLDPPKEIAVKDGRIFIPLEMIDDGKLHRFKHNAPDGTEIRYIVIKKNETAFGVGLDACDICGASGYYERNDQVVCILCDVVMNKSTIGFPGGCNPVPLAYRVEDGHMRIEIKDLEKDLWRFKE